MAAGPVAADVRPSWNTREGVELRLAASRALAGARIGVQAQEGRVVLSGQVRDDAQRERAIQIASRAPGVSAVEPRLETDAATPAPESRPDAAVAEDVARRLAGQSPSQARAEETWTNGWRVRGDGWALAVEVDDGDVLLEGIVPLQAHLHQFVLASRGVPGVRSVRADVALRPNPPYEDPYHP
jgi:osmotically-inducible protein OsmY